jgi:MFS family permease
MADLVAPDRVTPVPPVPHSGGQGGAVARPAASTGGSVPVVAAAGAPTDLVASRRGEQGGGIEVATGLVGRAGAEAAVGTGVVGMPGGSVTSTPPTAETAGSAAGTAVVRAERVYHGSSLLAYLAHAMTGFSVVAWVHDTTGDAGLAGLAVGSLLAPLLVLGLWAGSLADRMSRQRIVTRAQLVSIAASLALAGVAVGARPSSALVVGIALVYGVGMAFVPQTRLAMLANVTSAERLRQATVTVSMVNTVALAAGPALAGTVAGLVGWPTAFLAIALCWTGSTVLAFVTPVSPVAVAGGRAAPAGALVAAAPAGSPRSPGTLRAVGGYLRGAAVVRSLIVMVGVSILLLFGPLQVLVPTFAREVLDLDNGERGALMGVLGLGIVTGGVAATRAVRLRRLPRWLVGAAVVAMVLPLGLAVAGSVATAAAVLVVVGAAGGFFASVAPGIVQVAVSDDIRGRIMAAYVVVRWGLPALGAAAAGLVADVLGLRTTLAVYGVAGVLLIAIPGRSFLRSLRPAT